MTIRDSKGAHKERHGLPATPPRGRDAFQQSVTAEDLQAICRRAFGTAVHVTSAVELGGGMYNNTYRITAHALQKPVILRIAPAPDRQYDAERQLMRSEYATVPYLSPIADLVPRMLFADWSQEITGRDWMVQSHLDGVPGPDRLGDYPRTLWHGFFVLAAAPTPVISGVLDLDRTLWGDRAADWTIRMVKAKADERSAFWDTYGSLGTTAADALARGSCTKHATWALSAWSGPASTTAKECTTPTAPWLAP